MSIRQLSTDTQIALTVAERETRLMMMLGASVREAIEAGQRAFHDVLRIAGRDW